MSTLRISNIEAKSVPASATIDEKVKITNSSGDPLVFIDGKTSGITTVGINTTDPNITFDANSNVVVTGIITATKFSGQFEPTSVGIADSIFHTGDTNTAIRFPAADTFTVETGGSERLRIDPNGHVTLGIGVSAINNAYLTIPRLSTDGNAIELRSLRNDTAPADLAFYKSRSTSYGSYSAAQNGDTIMSIGSYVDTGVSYSLRGIYQTYLSGTGVDYAWKTTTSSEKMRLKADGKLGIGTDNPGVQLHILSSSTGLKVQRGNESFSVNANYGGQSHCAFELTNALSIRTGSGAQNERLRITSGGDVGIGVTNPNAKLHLASGSSSAVGDLTNPAFQIGATGNYRFGAYTTNEGAIIANKNGDDGIIFHTKTGTSAGSFGEGCRITSAGNLAFISGKGIDFSASGGPQGSGGTELLNDYEAGTFTPVLQGSSGSGTATHNHQSGNYVKIGRNCTIFFNIYTTNTASWSGNLRIAGLPFTVGSSIEAVAAVQWNRLPDSGSGSSTQSVFAILQHPNTFVEFRKNQSGTSQFNYLSVQNVHYLRVSMSYIVV